MATLQSTTLTDCFYIPDFIGAGSKMLFNNATAPTSWTKDITHNNKALRVVTGSVTAPATGQLFSTVLSSSRSIDLSSVSTVNAPITISPSPNVSPSGSVGNSDPYSVTTEQSISDLGDAATHNHEIQRALNNFYYGGPFPFPQVGAAIVPATQTTYVTEDTGQSQQHSHGGVSGGTHSHTFAPVGTHTHTAPSLPHSHPTQSIGTQSFHVNYVDVILATKN